MVFMRMVGQLSFQTDTSGPIVIYQTEMVQNFNINYCFPNYSYEN